MAYTPQATKIENPYYDGDFDYISKDNGQSRKTLQDPDLNDTEIVTSTQNVYYQY